MVGPGEVVITCDLLHALQADRQRLDWLDRAWLAVGGGTARAEADEMLEAASRDPNFDRHFAAASLMRQPESPRKRRPAAAAGLRIAPSIRELIE